MRTTGGDNEYGYVIAIASLDREILTPPRRPMIAQS